MNKMADITLNHSVSIVDYFLKQKSEDALSLAKRYVQNEDLKAEFKTF